MSLRKSPTLTLKMLAANRRNARRSTGPTTTGGRWNASQNALQHGHYAGSLRRCMLALRENAEEFDRVYGEPPGHGTQTAAWLPTGGFDAGGAAHVPPSKKEERSRNVL